MCARRKGTEAGASCKARSTIERARTDCVVLCFGLFCVCVCVCVFFFCVFCLKGVFVGGCVCVCFVFFV
jgi:hypothetical protein